MGFYKWLEHLCRIVEQLGCKIHFHTHSTTSNYIEGYVREKHPSIRAEFALLDSWDNLPELADKVNYDHLFVVVSARSGFISYQPSFERLPMQLSKNFSHSSIMLLYPDQYGDPQESVSLFQPSMHSTTTSRYHVLRRWFGDKDKKE